MPRDIGVYEQLGARIGRALDRIDRETSGDVLTSDMETLSQAERAAAFALLAMGDDERPAVAPSSPTLLDAGPAPVPWCAP